MKIMRVRNKAAGSIDQNLLDTGLNLCIKQSIVWSRAKKSWLLVYLAEAVRVGQYVQQRDPKDGRMLPQQCHPSTGYCWCVDQSGNPVSEQLRYPESARLQCTKEDGPVGKVGQYEPQLAKDGTYLAKQCRGSSGFCWCADAEGHAITGQFRALTRSAAAMQLNCDDERKGQAALTVPPVSNSNGLDAGLASNLEDGPINY